MPHWRFDQYVSILIICGLVLSYRSWFQPTLVATPPPTYALVKMADVPVLLTAPTSATMFTDSLSAQSVYVMDVDSSTPLLVKNPTDRRYPASTTKLLTALVSIRHYDLDQEFQVKEEAFTLGTTMGLKLGERISVRNLLYGLLMNSGNDAAFVLANNYPGGYDRFVQAMNLLAIELHLSQTTFTNPSGLDEEGHQSSARDLALLAREVMKTPFLRHIVSTPTYVMQTASGEAVRELRSTNALLGSEPGVMGVKTGTTLLAGEVLITQVERNGRQLLIVLMGSQDRYGETRRIIQWILDQYQWLPAQSEGVIQPAPSVAPAVAPPNP